MSYLLRTFSRSSRSRTENPLAERTNSSIPPTREGRLNPSTKVRSGPVVMSNLFCRSIFRTTHLPAADPKASRVFHENHRSSIQDQRTATLCDVESALPPHGMRNPQKLQCAVVRKNALGLSDRRHKYGIRLESIAGHIRRYNGIDSSAYCLQPTGFEIVFEPVDCAGAPGAQRKSPSGLIEGKDGIVRKVVPGFSFTSCVIMGKFLALSARNVNSNQVNWLTYRAYIGNFFTL